MFSKKNRKLKAEIESLRIINDENSKLIKALETENHNYRIEIKKLNDEKDKVNSIDEDTMISESVKFDKEVKSTKLCEFKNHYFKNNTPDFHDSTVILQILREINQFLKSNRYFIRKG